jgi:hypothetical protein
MAVVATIVSQQFSEAAIGGQSQMQIIWRVQSSTALSMSTGADLKSIRDATGGAPLSVLPGGTFGTSSMVSTLRLRSLKIMPLAQGQGKVFEVLGMYSSMYYWASPPSGATGLMLPVETDVQSGERTAHSWRTSVSLSGYGVGPTFAYGISYDIGGDKVDSGGKPVETPINQETYKVSIVFDSSQFTIGVANDYLGTAQGKWNSTDFLYFGSKQVICTGGNITHISDEYWRATFIFLYDYWSNCSQIPEFDNDGRPKLDGSSPAHAKNVFWQGEKRDSIDHNLIFNLSPNPTLAKQNAKEGTFLTFP